MTDRVAASPWHLQLAGPAARPAGHPDHSFVSPGLAVGEYPTPEDAGWLRDVCRVAAVVSLQDEIDLERKGLRIDALRAAYAAVGIALEHYPVADGDAAGLCAALDQIVDAVQRRLAARQGVYVHCNAGLNRAPSVIIALLHRHRGLSLDEACALVKARRACVPYMRALRAHYAR